MKIRGLDEEAAEWDEWSRRRWSGCVSPAKNAIHQSQNLTAARTTIITHPLFGFQ